VDRGKDGTYIIEHSWSLRATNLLDRDDKIQSFSFRVGRLACWRCLEASLAGAAWRPKGTTDHSLIT
jgi:hypothetical protein